MTTRFLLALLIATLALIDAAATHYAVSMGMALEANPIMAWAIVNWGWAGFWISKSLLTAPIVAYMLWGPNPGVVASIPIGAYVLLDMWHAYNLWLSI